jgi:dipeptidyl aminopeptidase/acylaminoacyl peptidase
MGQGLDVERLLTLGRATAVAPSPDGTWLAVAVSRVGARRGKFISELWRVPLSGGAPTRLTRGRSSDRAPAFRRDGALGFLSDRPTSDAKEADGGAQVWVLPTGGGEPVPLTDEPGGVLEFRFAREADVLVVLAPVFAGVADADQRAHAKDRDKRGPSALHYTDMPVRLWDTWIGPAWPHVVAYDGAGSGRRDLTPGATREFLPDSINEYHLDLSPNGDHAAVTRQSPGPDRIPDVAIEIVDVATGARRAVADSPRASFENPRFSPDGARLCCTRHDRHDGRIGRPGLWLVDVATGAGASLAADWDVWPVPQAWTPDGRAVLVSADDRGTVPVFRVDVSTQRVSRITSPQDGGCHDAIRPLWDGSAVVGLRHRLLHPPEPFAVELKENARPRLLAALSGFSETDAAAVARWEPLAARSADGAEVHSFLVLPTRAEGPLPALVCIHGGPIGAFHDGWHWRWNPLVAVTAGFAVVLPNPRGSTGYGQAFVEGIHNNTWGAECYQDVLAATEAAAARPEIDGARIGAAGGSFGGYMANWIGAKSDRFRCLISHAGLFDLTAFYGATDYPSWLAFEFGTDPHRDREAFERYSPARFVKDWKTPTLIIHGERDYRVPIGEALALFEALRAREVEAELLVFPDENHWILKPRNIEVWNRTLLDFATRHLQPA